MGSPVVCSGSDRSALVLQVLVVYLLEGYEAAELPRAPDGEQCVLGHAHGFLQVVGVGVAQVHDLRAGVDQTSHGRGARDGLGVVFGMGRGGCDGHQVGQVGHTPHEVQLLGALELAGEGGLVDGDVALEQGHRRVEQDLVSVPVEVAGLQERRDARQALAVDDDRTDDGLLGLEVVGQQLLRVDGHGVVSSCSGCASSPACHRTSLSSSADTIRTT